MVHVVERVKHFAPDARVVGSCPCGGALMFVEDEGARRPIVAQCSGCGELTGVARVAQLAIESVEAF